MKSQMIKNLFIIYLIGDKINIKKLIELEIISKKDIEELMRLGHVESFKNSAGEWLHIYPLDKIGSSIRKMIQAQIDVLTSFL